MTQALLGKSKRFDWASIMTYLALVFIGWLMLYAVYSPEEITDIIDPTTKVGRQTLWVIISISAFVLMLNIEWHFWNSLAYPIYAVTMFLLLLVLFVGSEIKGARSWFNFGSVSFQPAEIAKFGTSLALSSFLSFKANQLKSRRAVIIALSIFFFPILLILMQPDLGSAIVFMSFFILMYRRGFSRLFYLLIFILGAIFILSFIAGTTVVSLNVWYLSCGLLIYSYRLDAVTIGSFVASVIGSVVLYNQGFELYSWLVPAALTLVFAGLNIKQGNYRLVFILSFFIGLSLLLSFGTQYAFNTYLKPHQQDRLNAWLQPEKCDPSKSIYNVVQSKLAIGSGGFSGKGFLQGEMTKLKYVPEQSTDFIFSTIGEEQGFLGVAGVIALFTLLVIRLLIMAERARLEFIRNYLYCIAGILFIHFFINIGMTMGVTPVVGIPLPIISKGGTSLLTFSIMLGVAFKLDSYRVR